MTTLEILSLHFIRWNIICLNGWERNKKTPACVTGVFRGAAFYWKRCQTGGKVPSNPTISNAIAMEEMRAKLVSLSFQR